MDRKYDVVALHSCSQTAFGCGQANYVSTPPLAHVLIQWYAIAIMQFYGLEVSICAGKWWGAEHAIYRRSQCWTTASNAVRKLSGKLLHCKQLKLQHQSLRFRCETSHSKPSASRRYFKIWTPATDRCFPRRQNVAIVRLLSSFSRRMMHSFAFFNQGLKCLLAMKLFTILWCRISFENNWNCCIWALQELSGVLK